MRYRKYLKPRLVIPMLLALALPAYCQSVDFKALLFDKSLPQTLKPRDLNGEWRKVIVGEPPEIALAQGRMAGRMANAASGVYYTKGQTTTIGDVTYLIAYRPQISMDPEAMRRAQSVGIDGQNNPLAPKLAADATLALSLLNLRTSGNLIDVRPFDPEQDVEKELDREARVNEASVRNLRQIGLGILQYVQDYDELMPPMTSSHSMQQMRQPVPNGKSGTVQQVVQPYVRTLEIFVHPVTRQLYRPNPTLSRKSLAAIEEPAATVLFYESAPASDGKRAVLFMDGHVERVKESDWPRLKKESKVPP